MRGNNELGNKRDVMAEEVGGRDGGSEWKRTHMRLSFKSARHINSAPFLLFFGSSLFNKKTASRSNEHISSKWNTSCKKW